MSAPLSEQQLAEIRAREAATTKGPWGTYGGGVDGYDIVADLQETGTGYTGRRQIARTETWPMDNEPAHVGWDEDQDLAQIEADAQFMAHARTDVPALLAEVERLRAEGVRLQAVADREHKAFIDTHNALNLLAQDAQRVMAENGVQAQQAELVRVREQAAKFKEQRGEWARKARTAEARAAELEAERDATSEALDVAVKALVEKNRQYAELEARPLAWAEGLDAKSLDNLLISIEQAAGYEPMSGAIGQVHEVLAGFRDAVAEREFAAEAGHGAEGGAS